MNEQVNYPELAEQAIKSGAWKGNPEALRKIASFQEHLERAYNFEEVGFRDNAKDELGGAFFVQLRLANSRAYGHLPLHYFEIVEYMDNQFIQCREELSRHAELMEASAQ